MKKKQILKALELHDIIMSQFYEVAYEYLNLDESLVFVTAMAELEKTIAALKDGEDYEVPSKKKFVKNLNEQLANLDKREAP